MRRALWIGVAIGVLALVAAGAAGFAAWRSLDTPLAVPGKAMRFEVASGDSLTAVAAGLAAQGVVAHPRLLTWYARFKGDAKKIHAGEYELEPGLTPRGLLRKLVEGHVYLHQLTVVEGWRFEDLLKALRAEPAIASSGLDGPAIMARLGAPDLAPEGEFFPDTYKFPKGTSELEFLRRAHDELVQRLAAAWAERDSNIAVETPYQALILASIIEKETALASERAKIAGVFNARLERGMRLQTDPTVIYGLGAAFDGDIKTRDLEKDTPYNTYTRAGLPPTPIALPSEASIEAAVHPKMTGALYFVATGLRDGSHHFSKTLAEHDAAVREYLKRTAGERTNH